MLHRNNLTSVWKNHIRSAVRQQAIRDLSDYYDVHLAIDDHSHQIREQTLQGIYRPRPPTVVLQEKSKGLCRQLVVPDPIDALTLQVTVNAVTKSILGNQPSKNAFYQPQSAFINKTREERFRDAGYGSPYSWLAFQKAIFNFTRECSFLVVTDIANYYDHIDLEEVRNVFGSFDGVREDLLDFLFFTLSHFHWRPDYRPVHSMGLPQINFDAPRIVAHAFLFELDRFLNAKTPGRFVRYMDDIDIGVESIGQAKQIVRDVDLALKTRGVRLNSGKTRILTAAQASRHFFVRENEALNLAESAFERKKGKGLPTERESRFVQAYVERKLAEKEDYFDQGNGEKILKRYLSLSMRIGYQIPDETLRQFVILRPSLRELALLCLAHYGYAPKRLMIVYDFLLSDQRIDDASMFHAAFTLVHTNCPASGPNHTRLLLLTRKLSVLGPIGLGSAIWLLSKYGTQRQLLELVDANFNVWANDDWVGRQVGSLYPRFKRNRKAFSQFRSLIVRSRNRGAQSTFSMHTKILESQYSFQSIYHFLKASVPSLPRGVAHHKILILMTFMSSAAPKLLKTKLATVVGGWKIDSTTKRLLKPYL